MGHDTGKRYTEMVKSSYFFTVNKEVGTLYPNWCTVTGYSVVVYKAFVLNVSRTRNLEPENNDHVF